MNAPEITYPLVALKKDHTPAFVPGSEVVSGMIELDCRDDVGYYGLIRQQEHRQLVLRSIGIGLSN